MKVTYLSGMLAHLLQHSDIVEVRTLADVGLYGPDWHPDWLRVVLADGSAVVLSITATAADDPSADDTPAVFRPDDLASPR